MEWLYVEGHRMIEDMMGQKVHDIILSRDPWYYDGNGRKIQIAGRWIDDDVFYSVTKCMLRRMVEDFVDRGCQGKERQHDVVWNLFIHEIKRRRRKEMKQNSRSKQFIYKSHVG